MTKSFSLSMLYFKDVIYGSKILLQFLISYAFMIDFLCSI